MQVELLFSVIVAPIYVPFPGRCTPTFLIVPFRGTFPLPLGTAVATVPLSSHNSGLESSDKVICIVDRYDSSVYRSVAGLQKYSTCRRCCDRLLTAWDGEREGARGEGLRCCKIMTHVHLLLS